MNCKFYDATISGILDGGSYVKDCIITNLEYLNGFVEESLIIGDNIILGGNTIAYFINCWAGDYLETPAIIDMGGEGQTLVLQNFNGYVKIINKTGPEQINASLNAGWMILEDTVVSGTVTVIGVGVVQDERGNELFTGTWNGGVTINTDHLMSKSTISRAVWDESSSEHTATGSFGRSIADLKEGLLRSLGLAQENYFLDNTNYIDYNGQKLLQSGRLRIYSDSVSVGTDNDVLATYAITSTWSGDELLTYKVVKQ